jgi:hypothetical protein
MSKQRLRSILWWSTGDFRDSYKFGLFLVCGPLATLGFALSLQTDIAAVLRVVCLVVAISSIVLLAWVFSRPRRGKHRN